MSNFLHRKALRQTIKDLPLFGSIAKRLYRAVVGSPEDFRFESSAQYWDDRYSAGGNSGDGSYGRLALFKAKIINKFIADNNVHTVIEFGSGDGAQLKYALYKDYTGIDVSKCAIDLCQVKYKNDRSKRFFHTSSSEANHSKAELAISLDVIYHLVEDDIFHAYMLRLVSAATRFICIYSSNFDRYGPEAHIRHRCFTNWMKHCAPSWKIIHKISNPYVEDPKLPRDTSWSDFYFFEWNAKQ